MKRAFLACGIALAVLPFALFLALPRRPAPAPLPDLGRVPDFELVASDGRAVRRSDIAGPWIGDFIFTRCAGQCPMLTSRLRSLARRLPGVQLVSFSVDPADTPDRLALYARSNGVGGARWLFLTGRGDAVRRLSIEGFHLAAAEGGSPQEPLIHSKTLVLVDRDGTLRGYFDSEDAAAMDALAALAVRLAREAPPLSSGGRGPSMPPSARPVP